MIASKKEFFGGFAMLAAFAGVFAIMLMPIFEGKNLLDYMDTLYNSISKGSAYFIPKLQEKVKEHEGKDVSLKLVLEEEDYAKGMTTILTKRGVEAKLDGVNVAVKGDLGRILGFQFPVNFNMPYISRSFSEFWTRWHISLSSWLRDYLYIPLGGNRHGTAKTYRNLALTMLLGGLWHGAAWTFVAWGALHGLYLVVQRLLGGSYRALVERLRIPGWLDSGFLVVLVFALTCVAWIFFRSPDFSTAWVVLGKIAFFDGRGVGSIVVAYTVAKGMVLIAGLFLLELTSLRVEVPRMVLERPVVRAVSFAVLLWCIAFFGTFEGGQFIYFQF